MSDLPPFHSSSSASLGSFQSVSSSQSGMHFVIFDFLEIPQIGIWMYTHVIIYFKLRVTILSVQVCRAFHYNI